MAVTYSQIATQTLGSATSSVTFSSIPSTYTDLVIIANGGITTGPDDVKIRLNGDSGSNYSSTLLRGSGSAVLSYRVSNQTEMFYASYFGSGSGSSVGIINIQNYSNSTTYKTVLCRGNSAADFVNAAVSLWRSTSAVNSVTLIGGGSTFISGSTFSLYGIKAA